VGPIPEAALFLAGKGVAALGIAASAWLTGLLFLPRRDGDGAAERAAIATALGLAVIAQELLLLGIAGALTRTAVVVLLLVTAAAAATLRRADLLADLRELRDSRPPLPWLLAAGVLLLLLALPAIRLPLSFDETMYHLPYAKAFAETGGLPWLEDLRFPVFPQAAEALFAACLLLADDVATHLVSLVAVLASACLAGLWARREAGGMAGLLAAALILGDPVVACYSGVAYVDATLMLFVTGSLYALSTAARSGEARWIAVSGFLAGAAASVKYHGLFFALAGGALLLIPRGARRWRRAGLFALAAAAAALPTYGRLIVETGNPVFPFASFLFGPSDWSDWNFLLSPSPRRSGVGTLAREYVARAVRLVDELVIPGGAAAHPPLSPFLGAAALAAVVVGLRRKGQARGFLAVAATYVLVVVLLPGDPRFLLPIAPATAALGGAALAAGIRRPGRRSATYFAAAVALVALIPGVIFLVWVLDRRGPIPASAAVRERTLEALLPAYSTIRFMNRRYGSEYVVYAFGAENMHYFAEGRLLGDFGGPWAYWRVLSRASSAEGLRAVLAEFRATHLLVSTTSYHADRIPREGLVEEYSDAAAVVYRLPSPGSAGGGEPPP
jgi:hypothetical protein